MSSYNLLYEKIGNDIKCIEDEIPFEIPSNWCWTKISQLFDTSSGTTPKKSKRKLK